MTTEVVEKRAGKRECAECGASVSKGMSECPECGSDSITKSIIIVRKEVTDESVTDEEVGDALEAVEDDDSDDDEEDGEEVEDDEEDDSTDEEDEEEEPVVEKSFTDSESALIAVDALTIATKFADKIAKAFVSKNVTAEYESVMTELNEDMDEAAAGWLAKSFSTDGNEISKKAGVVRQQITDIIKHAQEGGVMTQRTRPASLDGLELPAEVAEYVSGLEEDAGIQKNDIFKGLTPEATEIVKNAQTLIEEREQEKWLEVAKKFDAVPGDRAELAKSLRTLHSTDPKAYDALVKSLEGANEAAKRGDITKVYGLPGGGEPTSVIEKRKNEAQKLVESGEFPTIEQAEVHLLGLNPSEYGQS